MFDPPPKLHTYNYRIGLNIFIFLLMIYQFVIEYNLNIKDSGETNSKLQKNIFIIDLEDIGRKKKNKILFSQDGINLLNLLYKYSYYF